MAIKEPYCIYCKHKKTLANYYCKGGIRTLAVTYFHMGRPHTIIGAKWFHFRVRDGIGWFTLAMAARKTGCVN